MRRALPSETPDSDAERVAAHLSANPGFLAERPSLYRTLQPPVRVHGDTLADHMAAMLAAARADTGQVAASARASQSFCHRASTAIMALIGARPPAATVAAEWPGLLRLETAVLVTEGEPAAHLRTLPSGDVARLLGRQTILVRTPEPETAHLHGEASALIAREALVRLPGPAPRLLLLGAREAARLPDRGGTAALLLLAEALARALDPT